jgi:hypothetical protein
MTDAEDLTFDEEAAMEAARERKAVPHPRDILKRGHDRILRGHRRDVALEKWGPMLDEMMTRDLELSGLPATKGTMVSHFATHAGEPGVIYAANNRGLFRSGDAGRTWKARDLPWPGAGLADGVAALACLPE